MKSRTLLIILLVVGVVGGLIWWIQQPSAADSANVAAASNTGTSAPSVAAPAPSKAETSKPGPVVAAPTPTNPEAKIAAPTNPRGIVAPPASAMVAAPAASSTATPVVTQTGSSPAANSPGTTAVSTKGLRFAAGPDGGAESVLAYLQRMSGAPSYAKILGDPSQLQMDGSPIAYYKLSIPDIVNGGGLETAKLDGFVYIADASGQPIILEEIKSSDPSVALTTQMRPLEFPQHASDISAALSQLASNNQVNAGTFEVRLLTDVIWLKSDAGSSDLIYTLARAAQGLKANTLYTADDYLKVYRKLMTPKTPRTSTGG